MMAKQLTLNNNEVDLIKIESDNILTKNQAYNKFDCSFSCWINNWEDNLIHWISKIFDFHENRDKTQMQNTSMFQNFSRCSNSKVSTKEQIDKQMMAKNVWNPPMENSNSDLLKRNGELSESRSVDYFLEADWDYQNRNEDYSDTLSENNENLSNLMESINSINFVKIDSYFEKIDGAIKYSKKWKHFKLHQHKL